MKSNDKLLIINNKLLYTDFPSSIISNDFCTKYIAVEKGVLQGEEEKVKEEKFTKFGYRIFKGFLSQNWFQLADDAVAVTSLEGENQILLNLSDN